MNPEVVQKALVQMLGEAQNREAQALIQVHVLQAKLDAVNAELDAVRAATTVTEDNLSARD